MRKFAALALIAVLVGCSRSTVDRTKEEDRIREAVFEYLMGKYDASVFFLSIGEVAGDPNSEIMSHFEGHNPPVKPASQGIVGGGESVNDSEGNTGVIIKAAAIKWISDTEVEVKGGYFAGTKNTSGNTYHLVLKDGEWVVDKDTVDWGA
ncbi:MAG TPA: hypothetical protein VFI02_02225 [Armatimonadota bacterium]|nr:hypothetical protein [Armatimonadota bacterium]